MTNQELAITILKLIGDKSNVISAACCMTRLRLSLKDHTKVNMEELKKTDGVLGLVEDTTFQIILGPGKVRKVYDCFTELISSLDSNQPEQTPAHENNWEANKDKETVKKSL